MPKKEATTLTCLLTWATDGGFVDVAAALLAAAYNDASADHGALSAVEKRVNALAHALAGVDLTSPFEGPEAAERALAPLASALAFAPTSELLSLALARTLLEARRPEGAARVLRLVERQRRDAPASPSLTFPLPAGSAPSNVGVPGTGSLAVEPGEDSTELLTATLPRPPSLPVLLAHAQARGGDLAAALATLTSVVQGDPDGSTPDGVGAGPLLKAFRDVAAARDRGNAAYKAGSNADAVAAYGEAQEIARKRAGSALSFLASNASAAHLAAGSVEEALNEALSSLRLCPCNVKAWARATACFSAQTPPAHDLAAVAIAVQQYLTPLDAPALLKALLGARSKADDEAVDGHGQRVLQGLEGLVLPLSQPGNDSQYQAALTGWKAAKGQAAAGRFAPIFGRDPSPEGGARALSAARVVLVDWFATWCGPCKQIAPHFAQLAAGIAPVAFVKVDGDLCKASASGQNAPKAKASAAAAECCGGDSACGKKPVAGDASGGGGVKAFPTFTLFLDGFEIARLEGGDGARLSSMVKEGLAAWTNSPPRPATVAGKHGGTAPAPPALLEALAARDCRADVTIPIAHALRTLGAV